MSRRAAVAVIVTAYTYNSHADMILGRLLGDHDYEPKLEVVSLYTDQVPHNDLSREAAARFSIPIYPTIGEAIAAPHLGRPIDGVMIIGEHGDYPTNDKGQTLYPRCKMLAHTLQAFDALGLCVPVFSDKHLSYDTQEACWMYKELKKRKVPFMGGSSIPHTDPIPSYKMEALRTMDELLVVSCSALVESYGFHGVEVLQSLAEKRSGGEHGVRSVRAVNGTEVWRAMERKEWPEDLLLQALSVFEGIPDQHPRQLEPEPYWFEIEYMDGLKGNVVQFPTLVEKWGYAFRCRDEPKQSIAAICNSDNDRPFRHFERFTRLIEQFVLTRTPPFPMERTLLTTGITNGIVESLYTGKRQYTPELQLSYKSRC